MQKIMCTYLSPFKESALIIPYLPIDQIKIGSPINLDRIFKETFRIFNVRCVKINLYWNISLNILENIH